MPFLPPNQQLQSTEVTLNHYTLFVLLCSAETDLVLPLIQNDPSCLDIKNSAGVTARHLLRQFKDRTKLLHGQSQACLAVLVIVFYVDVIRLSREVLYVFRLHFDYIMAYFVSCIWPKLQTQESGSCMPKGVHV